MPIWMDAAVAVGCLNLAVLLGAIALGGWRTVRLRLRLRLQVRLAAAGPGHDPAVPIRWRSREPAALAGAHQRHRRPMSHP